MASASLPAPWAASHEFFGLEAERARAPSNYGRRYGASVIVCWYPNYNSSSWYGLRLKSIRRAVQDLCGSVRDEKSEVRAVLPSALPSSMSSMRLESNESCQDAHAGHWRG